MNILKICYLCGKALVGKLDEDHIVQRQFIKGQPKQKGLDYTGTIKVHESCNKKFGNISSNAEAIAPKALTLLKVLYYKKYLFRQKKDDPEFRIIAIAESDLKGFTKSDLKFFKLIDFRNQPYSEINNPLFYKDKEKYDPFKISTDVALTVLAKSSAALLFNKYSYYPLNKWNIYAKPFLTDPSVDYDTILGNTKQFSIGVKAWIKQFPNGDWFCAYKLEEFQVYFIFTKSEDLSNVNEFKNILPRYNIFYFRSNKLIDLVDCIWSENIY